MKDVNYYTAKESNGENIYDIWERGEAFGNSITPSTYDKEYQLWMLNLIFDKSKKKKLKVLSLGCGNATIEKLLVGEGHSVTAFDINEEAIQYALSKGVDAQVCDLNKWEPTKDCFDVVYCDGILGHLLEPTAGFSSIFDKVMTTLNKDGMVLISNDSSDVEQDVQEHPDLPSFYWFSDEYLKNQLRNANFENVETLSYFYNRPLTGGRKRLIAIGFKN